MGTGQLPIANTELPIIPRSEADVSDAVVAADIVWDFWDTMAA